MYANRNDFEAAVLACNPSYPDRDLASIEVAWNVYNAARQTDLDMLILGRWRLLSVEEAPGIDMWTQQNTHIMDEIFTGGSIMNSGNWTILVNDAWVLGGVHSHTDFHLASPRDLPNIFDFGANRLTVTGRELAGLASFGYRIQQSPLGEVARCVNPHLADQATFQSYREVVDQYSGQWIGGAVPYGAVPYWIHLVEE